MNKKVVKKKGKVCKTAMASKSKHIQEGKSKEGKQGEVSDASKFRCVSNKERKIKERETRMKTQ